VIKWGRIREGRGEREYERRRKERNCRGWEARKGVREREGMKEVVRWKVGREDGKERGESARGKIMENFVRNHLVISLFYVHLTG